MKEIDITKIPGISAGEKRRHRRAEYHRLSSET